MEEPQPSHEKQQLNSKRCGQALSRSFPQALQVSGGLRKQQPAGPVKQRAVLCSESSGCRQQAQVQGDSLEGNLVLTPPLVEFTRRKSGTYRINRRWKNSL